MDEKNNETGKVSIRFGRPSQRLHHRLTAPLDVVVHGHPDPRAVLDWSTAGLRFRSSPSETFHVEDVIMLALSVPFHDFNVSFDIQARIARVDAANGDVAVQFVDLSARPKELLHYFSDNLLRGEIAPIGGTLKRLDLPVTPPRPEVPKERGGTNGHRSVRPWLVGSTYLSLGVALAVGLLYTLNGTIFLVSSEKAILYSPVTELIAPEDGTVSAVYVGEGDRVAAGHFLLTITSPRLEQLQSEARIRVQEALIEQQRLAELVETEVHTLIQYGDISADQVIATEARLVSAQKQAVLLDGQLQRLIPLLQGGFISAQQVDQLETDVQRAQGAVIEAQADLRIARMAHDAALTGKYYSADRPVGPMPELRAELSAAKGQVRLAKIRLQELQKQVDRLTLRAPIGSYRVQQVSVMTGSAVSGGRSAISLLSDELLKVYAVVPSDKLARIAIGRRAKVFIPALSRQISAEVTSIGPRIWSLPENVRRLLGTEPMDSGLVVLSLAAEDPGTDALQAGLPVSVAMENERAQHAVHRVSHAISYTFGVVLNALGVTSLQAAAMLPLSGHGPVLD